MAVPVTIPVTTAVKQATQTWWGKKHFLVLTASDSGIWIGHGVDGLTLFLDFSSVGWEDSKVGIWNHLETHLLVCILPPIWEGSASPLHTA